jgi:hypothetical protein
MAATQSFRKNRPVFKGIARNKANARPDGRHLGFFLRAPWSVAFWMEHECAPFQFSEGTTSQNKK